MTKPIDSELPKPKKKKINRGKLHKLAESIRKDMGGPIDNSAVSGGVEELENRFRKEFDELGLKPPKNSMPNLERELIIDYWRKALNSLITKRVVEELENYFKWAYGERCKTSDRVDFPDINYDDPKNSRCMVCEQYERLDEYLAQLNNSISEVSDEK